MFWKTKIIILKNKEIQFQFHFLALGGYHGNSAYLSDSCNSNQKGSSILINSNSYIQFVIILYRKKYVFDICS